MKTLLILEKRKAIFSSVRRYQIFLDNEKVDIDKKQVIHSVKVEKGEHFISLTQPFTQKQVLKVSVQENNSVIRLQPEYSKPFFFITGVIIAAWFLGMHLLGFKHLQLYMILGLFFLLVSTGSWTKLRLTVEEKTVNS
jgi:hypothetical protein